MKKIYTAVVHGKPANTVDIYVDYLVKTPDGNYSQVVDKGITGAKKAELSYEVLKNDQWGREWDAREKGLSLGKSCIKDRKDITRSVCRWRIMERRFMGI